MGLADFTPAGHETTLTRPQRAPGGLNNGSDGVCFSPLTVESAFSSCGQTWGPSIIYSSIVFLWLPSRRAVLSVFHRAGEKKAAQQGRPEATAAATSLEELDIIQPITAALREECCRRLPPGGNATGQIYGALVQSAGGAAKRAAAHYP